MMMMNYGYVYVASIAMGANKNQALQAIKEARNTRTRDHHAYAPCINHGIDMRWLKSTKKPLWKQVTGCSIATTRKTVLPERTRSLWIVKKPQ
jgi:pyruvate/2-oxoacid:ferredoxin oxidoreductase beta subunit